MPSQELHLVDPDNLLVYTVGERIRHFRALRGISRKILSTGARVSERHLAQIETGTGNVSIRLLGQIAHALGVPAQELLEDEKEHISEEVLLQDALSKLTSDQRAKVLEYASSLNTNAVQATNVVALIGLRGAGKSTLGRKLSESKRVPFIRITEEIEKLAGMAVAEIYSLSGETGYRRYELSAIQNALSEPNGCIIEAGGSLVANSPAFNALLTGSFVVWVQTSSAEHMDRVVQQGDLRPMEGRADAMEDLERILKERETFYSQAHAQINTSHVKIAASFRRLQSITESIWRASP